MVSRLLSRKIYFSLLMALLVIVVSSGCAVTLVSKYDERTEKYATDIRDQVDTFLTSLERNSGEPAADYAQNTKFYDDTNVSLRGMLNRASQIEKNKITVKQTNLLIQNVDALEKLHIIGPLNQISIKSSRSSFESLCGAIIKFEILKKRGES